MEHYLKIWPEQFCAIQGGDKTFEVRHEDDRRFEVDDWLILEEWDPETRSYTGSKDEVVVTYILRGPAFGIPEGMVVMGIKRKFFGLSHMLVFEDERVEDLAQRDRLIVRQDHEEFGIFGL